jgi:hypothetical protein
MFGALSENGPAWLGILLNLSRNYRGLADIVSLPESAVRLFFRLLDARIMTATLQATLVASGLEFPRDAARVSLHVEPGSSDAQHALERVGTGGGEGILRWARTIELETVAMLDSLLPLVVQNDERGHAQLYSLRLLSHSEIRVDGAALTQRPLVMLDDGHNLARSQRDALLVDLGDRSLHLARWYSERYDALTSDEILRSLGTKGRDYELVELENVARGTMPDGERQRFRPGQFERVLTDIGNRRAATALKRHADLDEEFAELFVDDDEDVLPAEQGGPVLDVLQKRLLGARESRYAHWIDGAVEGTGYSTAVRMREVEILIARDRDRSQRELFDIELTDAEARERSNAAIREAARLLLSNEFGLPFYYGHDIVAKLGSHNIEQYLVVCGDLFAEIMARVTMDELPHLSPHRQDRIIRRTSDLLWRQVPRLVTHGRDVESLILGIVDIARHEAGKPTVPYPPGVTGTAMLMAERELLMQPAFRQRNEGADRLHAALAEAIAHNLISAEPGRSVKNQSVMVLYLNRLLCPRFGLALGRGSYRERRLNVMAGWLMKPLPAEAAPNIHVEQPLPL